VVVRATTAGQPRQSIRVSSKIAVRLILSGSQLIGYGPLPIGATLSGAGGFDGYRIMIRPIPIPASTNMAMRR
jgi:hypothetical protein